MVLMVGWSVLEGVGAALILPAIVALAGAGLALAILPGRKTHRRTHSPASTRQTKRIRPLRPSGPET